MGGALINEVVGYVHVVQHADTSYIGTFRSQWLSILVVHQQYTESEY